MTTALVGAVPFEQHDEWVKSQGYLDLNLIREFLTIGTEGKEKTDAEFGLSA